MNLNYFFENKLYAKQTNLCGLMSHYGSDKSGRINNRHNYTTIYSYIFEQRKYQIKNVFEMGLGTNDSSFMSNMGGQGSPGGSLRAWRDYFPNANIYGADIDEKILFHEERIETYYCDQTNTDIINDMFIKIGKNFDFIVDDGLHLPHAAETFLMVAQSYLAVGGIYIVEDIHTDHLHAYQSLTNRICNKFSFCELCFLPGANNQYDNNILIIAK